MILGASFWSTFGSSFHVFVGGEVSPYTQAAASPKRASSGNVIRGGRLVRSLKDGRRDAAGCGEDM